METIATAQELYDATLYYASKPQKTRDEQDTEWIDWFKKRVPKLLKDAAARREFSLEVPLPYQPIGRTDRDGLRGLRAEVQTLLPGCVLEFIGHGYDDASMVYVLEISWHNNPKESNTQSV